MGNKKFNIDVYCLCWNEAKIIPFVIQYWKRFARHVYVYDNGSDDGSLELLAQYPDWITVRHFESNGEFDELTQVYVRNNCWKGSDADWVVVCDMDECLYAKDIFGEIEKLEEKDVTMVAPQWCDVWSMEFPVYDENRLCHEIMGGVLLGNETFLHKCLLFKPSQIQETNFGPGSHFCSPSGFVIKEILDKDIYIVHLKNLGVEYKIERYKQLDKRNSIINKKCGLCTHYSMTEDKIREEFNEYTSKEKKML